MQSNEKPRTRRRSRIQRGAELIEFTLALLPLFAVMLTAMDVAWGIFSKATLQYAAHMGLRYGVTITKTQTTAANSDLTTMVKNAVQANSLGLLGGTRASYIHVNYYDVSTGAPVLNNNPNTVGTTPPGNSPPNLMQVSVDSYQLPALVPRFFTWAKADVSATTISVIAVDSIEPNTDVPPMGSAP